MRDIVDNEIGIAILCRNDNSMEIIAIGLMANLVNTSILLGVEHTGNSPHTGIIELLRQVDKAVEGKDLFEPLTPIVLGITMDAIPESYKLTIDSVRKYLNRIIRGIRHIGFDTEVANQEEIQTFLGNLTEGCLSIANRLER